MSWRRCYLRILAVLGALPLVSVIPTPVAHGQATTRSAATQPTPTAAELIQRMQAADRWVDDIKRFDMELEGQWIKDHEGKTLPPGRVHLAFDERRIYQSADGRIRPGMFDLRLWDGATGIWRSNVYANPEYCRYFTKPVEVMTDVLGDVPWFRTRPLRFWFTGPQWQGKDPFDAVKDWDVVARGDADMPDCYVLEKPGADGESCRRLWVGISDGRLHGEGYLRLPDEAREHILDAVRNLAAAAGTRLDSPPEIVRWVQRMPEAKRAEMMRQMVHEMRDEMAVTTRYWFEDYREVSAGHRAPMKMRYITRQRNGQLSECQVKVLRFSVDQPLDDKLFTPDLKLTETVQIMDERHTPPLIYFYKANRTPEEWKQIEQEAKERAAAGRP